MKDLGTVTLETERLILRRIAESDAENMFKNYASDPLVTKYLTWPAHTSIDTSRAYIEKKLAGYERDDFYFWAIVPKELGEIIGSISVVSSKPEAESVHIGYAIGSRWWRRGYTSEALSEVIRFLFEDVGVGRIDARHDPRNVNSGAVMRKCGLKYEGTLRKSDRNNQGISDADWYAVLRDEYFAAKEK